ncbi:ATP-binding protein [Chitinophaga rhizophila]|uniref:histidine kinase n=1 Tax=Chitinophaga rhizophila TaxID=2866212 RepID=A0ABS7GH35_9BACT|nr:ATP-binding protein [Chitinophaga rhizophila]MBW8686997.1 GAF domain-containing protein [Chitinophaga rhizophila]
MNIRSIVNKDNVNLLNCESEPIHIPGCIQEHGFLIGLSADSLLIRYCSENVLQFTGFTHTQLLGKPLQTICSAEEENMLRNFLAAAQFDQSQPFSFAVNNVNYNTKPHISNSTVILEFEPFPDGSLDLPNLYRQTQQFVSYLNVAQDLRQLCHSIAQETRAITGYDRVMIYRFDKNYNGEVIAEAKREDLLPLLGHNYPHTDIPAQARALYLTNMLRMIVDVDYKPVPLYTIADEREEKQLDLSQSILRSVSPIHIEYLKNMGVKATLTISLIQDNRLWGMISCHHYSAKNIPHYTRLSTLLQGYFFMSQIKVRQAADEYKYAQEIEQQIQPLLELMTTSDNFIEDHFNNPLLRDCIKASGFVIIYNDVIYRNGNVPGDNHLLPLLKWLRKHASGGQYTTDHLIEVYPPADELSDTVAGLIYHALDSEGRNCVIWFRPEMEKSINWAGNPSKAIVMDADGARLSPRKSFELWKEVVKFFSLEWAAPEQAVAARLANNFQKQAHLADIRREETRYKQLAAKLESANAELENFNWISAHDLKEPLRKIQLFASRTFYSEVSIDVYKESLIKIQTAASKIQLLLDSMLSFATMSKTNEGFETINLNNTLSQVLGKYRKEINAKEAVITTDALPHISVLPYQTEQLFSNLISNSLKFSKDDVPLKLNVTYEKTRYYHVISFADNGIGFHNKYADIIFKIFQSLNYKGNQSNIGIGLAICKKIMDNHNGSISADGQEGRGAVFSVSFPV